MITIPQSEYDALIKDSVMLACLKAAGVDNWEGHHLAVQAYNEEMGEDD